MRKIAPYFGSYRRRIHQCIFVDMCRWMQRSRRTEGQAQIVYLLFSEALTIREFPGTARNCFAFQHGLIVPAFRPWLQGSPP
jgi:hypothetical protein